MQHNANAATVATITTAAEPDGAPRLAGLDILRGIAILGILFMNINAMGASIFTLIGNIRHVGWTDADRLAWGLREVLADGTARCLLEMLFGVGMVILTDRAATALGEAACPDGRLARWRLASFGPWPVMRAYYWRNLVLFLFGVVHLFILLWPGDILHTYGIAAMVAFLFRRLGPRTLLGIGLILAMAQLIGGGVEIHLAQTRIAHAAELRAAVAHGTPLNAADRKTLAEADRKARKRVEGHAGIARLLAADDRGRSAATGTAASWVKAAWAADGFLFGIGPDAGFLEPLFIWEAASTMLIGAALFRGGIIQGRRSRQFYLGMLVVGYGLGLGLRLGRTLDELRFTDQPSLWDATGEVSRLATTLGHVSLVWLLLGTAVGARLLRPFAAVGTTALSLYIAQTLICLWLLYPPFALGLYGKHGWLSLMLIAAAIDAGLLVLANWWVRRFAIAPVEWAWRSIVVGRRLPFRRRGAVPAGAMPLPA